MTDHPSPFLPGTNIQVAWDAHSITTFKTCPRLYYYQIIQGWTTNAENIHLRWGIEYHHSLEDYDRLRAAGVDHEDATREVVRSLLIRIFHWQPNPTEGKKSEELKTKANLLRSVIWYLEKYPKETDPAKTYLMADGKPAVEVNFKFELDWGPQTATNLTATQVEQRLAGDFSSGRLNQPYLLCGYLDRVVNYQDSLFVMDRKTTTGSIGEWFFDNFDPDCQMTVYSIAGQVVFNSPIRGVIIDAACIQVGGTLHDRGITYRNKDNQAEWLQDLRFWLDQAEQCAIEDHWPMNDSSCGKYGGCRFRKICSKAPQVRERFLKNDFIQAKPEDRWNPLKPRS